MINIVVPMAGSQGSEKEGGFPLPLTELSGKPIIQLVVENFDSIGIEKHYIFLVNDEDCTKFHLDDTISLLAGERSTIIRVKNPTRGAACTSLLAAHYIQNSDPLIITNSDQVIYQELREVHFSFMEKNYDAGVICFSSVHPRWSYVRLDDDKMVVEAAEKRPISRNAIAGFYWFRQGKDFVRAAMDSIEKDASVEGVFYIAPVLNEFILNDMNVGCFKISNEAYASFYSPERRTEFQASQLSVVNT